MVGTFLGLEGVDRRGRSLAPALRPFLQPCLGVTDIGAGIGEHRFPQSLDKSARRVHAAIKIDRGDHRFQRAAHDGTARAPARRFGTGKNQMFPQADIFADPGAGFPAHQAVHPPGQRAFVLGGIAPVERFGHHQRQHPVAQELQPFVGMRGIGAGMGQRALEQVFVLKPVSELFGKRLAQDVISRA